MANQKFVVKYGEIDRVGNSVNWTYHATEEGIFFTNGAKEQDVYVPGNWIGKHVIFSCDGPRSKFLGEIKKPKDPARRILWEKEGVYRHMITYDYPFETKYPEIIVDEKTGIVRIMKHPCGAYFINPDVPPTEEEANAFVNKQYTKAWFTEPVCTATQAEINMLSDQKFMKALAHESIVPARYIDTHISKWALEIHGISGVSDVPGYVKQADVIDLIKRHQKMPKKLCKTILVWLILGQLIATVQRLRERFNYGPMVPDTEIFYKHIEPVLEEPQKEMIKNKTCYKYQVGLHAIQDLQYFSTIMKEKDLDEIISVF